MKNDNYEYGFDLYEDIKQLYGENYEEINSKRYKLLEGLNNDILEIKLLRNIIQNPVPITREQFNEWVKTKNKIINEYQYDLTLRTIHTLKNIEDFAYVHHVIE